MRVLKTGILEGRIGKTSNFRLSSVSASHSSKASIRVLINGAAEENVDTGDFCGKEKCARVSNIQTFLQFTSDGNLSRAHLIITLGAL